MKTYKDNVASIAAAIGFAASIFLLASSQDGSPTATYNKIVDSPYNAIKGIPTAICPVILWSAVFIPIKKKFWPIRKAILDMALILPAIIFGLIFLTLLKTNPGAWIVNIAAIAVYVWANNKPVSTRWIPITTTLAMSIFAWQQHIPKEKYTPTPPQKSNIEYNHEIEEKIKKTLTISKSKNSEDTKLTKKEIQKINNLQLKPQP